MGSLKEFITEEIIKPEIGKNHQPVKAVILEYDNSTNRAQVMYKDSFQADGITQLFDVPLQIGSGGSHSAGPFTGDEVWISFLGGDVKRPIIISLVDEDYENKTRGTRNKHMRKGSLMPNMICDRMDY